MKRRPQAQRVLVVLTGPVGGGKSTVARALARRLRACGYGAAAIDLDLLDRMQHEGYDDEAVWRTARRAAAALADLFFGAGARAVIVEGGFFTQQECDDLLDNVTTETRSMIVTLRVSFEEALRRVQRDPDPDRMASKVPENLRWLHNQFVKALPFLSANSLVLEADSPSADDLASTIAESLPRELGER